MQDRIDSAGAWHSAVAALIIASIALGAPYVVITALKAVAADMGGHRSIPSAAAGLATLGAGIGGLAMGRIAEHVGMRWVVSFGALMVCAGLALSAGGTTWQLYVGHGLLIGLIGIGAINAPLYVYVTNWFERRRGTALALFASGQYVAGACWPPLFELAVAAYGWRPTMFAFGLVVAALVVPLAVLFLKAAPVPSGFANLPRSHGGIESVLQLRPNMAFALLAGASFLCCVPMAMPSSHLIALCGDLGMAPGSGTAMLTVLLVCAIISRQFWGWVSDCIGGLRTVLVGSLAQATAIVGFVVTQDEIGLLAVATAFGLGFSGLFPAYVVAVRELFPASEASWRIPILLLTGMSGMAAGSWLAGAIYDYAGFYAPAFATGFVFNVVNLVIVAGLVLLWRQSQLRPALP